MKEFDYRKAQEEALNEGSITGSIRALCPRTYFEKCRLCEQIGMRRGTYYLGVPLGWNSYPGILYSRDANFKHVYPESVRDRARQYQAREEIWTFALFLNSDKPDQPYLFRLSWSVFDQLKTYAKNEEYTGFWNPRHGTDITIEKTIDPKTQRFTYHVVPARKASPLKDMSVLDKLPDRLTVEMIIKHTESDEFREFPVMTVGRLEQGKHVVRFLPILKDDPDVWFLRLYWHYGLTDEELEKVNRGELNLFPVLAPSVAEEEDDIPEDEIFGAPKEEEEVTEEEPEEEEMEEVEEEEEATSVPACFGDKDYFDANDPDCQDCDWFVECKREIKKKMKTKK